MLPLFEALRHDEHETGRFLGTVAGTVSSAEFFAPENLARILARPRPSAPEPQAELVQG